MSSNEEVSHPETSRDASEEQPENMETVLLTPETSQFDTSNVDRELQFINIQSRDVMQ